MMSHWAVCRYFKHLPRFVQAMWIVNTCQQHPFAEKSFSHDYSFGIETPENFETETASSFLDSLHLEAGRVEHLWIRCSLEVSTSCSVSLSHQHALVTSPWNFKTLFLDVLGTFWTMWCLKKLRSGKQFIAGTRKFAFAWLGDQVKSCCFFDIFSLRHLWKKMESTFFLANWHMIPSVSEFSRGFGAENPIEWPFVFGLAAFHFLQTPDSAMKCDCLPGLVQ